MKVIRAQLADVSQAAPLFAAYREFYGEPYDLEASASFLASRLARDESIVLIAQDDDGVPVGFSQIYPAFSSTRLAPIWILNDLYVSEDARGTGAVDALLDTAATQASKPARSRSSCRRHTPTCARRPSTNAAAMRPTRSTSTTRSSSADPSGVWSALGDVDDEVDHGGEQDRAEDVEVDPAVTHHLGAAGGRALDEAEHHAEHAR